MAHTYNLTLNVDPPFNFESAATAHGWIALPPNRWLSSQQCLQRVEHLSSGAVVLISVTEAGTPDCPKVAIQIQNATQLATVELAEAKLGVARMLRLDEDFSDFYQLCCSRQNSWQQLTVGVGRLLRSPTVFEDAVKTICTTNTNWTSTIRMVTNLVNHLGQPCSVEPSDRAFPTPEAIATADSALFQETLRLGYRADYIRHLAEQVASKRLDLEAFRDSSIPSADLKRQLLSLKGIGTYAAHTLMMLLGRYEELAIDSELRAFTQRHYLNSEKPTDREIQAIYQDWGKWKYLAYWFDPIGNTTETVTID